MKKLFIFSLLLVVGALCQEYVGSPISLDEEAVAAGEYWTPERMRMAQPRDYVINSRRNPNDTVELLQPDGEPGEVNGSMPEGSFFNDEEERALIGRPATQRYPLWIQGKVFMTFNGRDFVCSASAAGRYTVWTAGHCVYDEEAKEYAERWIFVPGYYRGSRPLGMWTYYQLWTTNGWTAGNWAYDYALVVLRNNARGAVGTVLGHHGYKWNQNPSALTWTSLGYPSASPFTGEALNSCRSRLVRRATTYSPPPLGIVCDSTEGSSGGPWLLDFSTTSWSNVNSVNSFGRSTEPNRMYGPYFTAAVKTFYDQVNAIVPR